MSSINQLRGIVAPNLPIAAYQYSQQYQDEYSNVLRLYFNQLSNFTGIVSGINGGLELASIGASDTTDQYTTDNTPTIVKWNTLESAVGFSLNANNYAVANASGIYKIDYSLQFANTDNSAHDVDVWLRVNNIDVARSDTKFTIPARKSAGVPHYLVAYSTVTFKLNAGDQVSLYWATDKAYNTVGPVDGVFMEYQAAQTSPFAHPSIPSAIGAITFMSSLY